MKIIYLHQYFTPPIVSGGTRSWEFCIRLVHDRWNVSMICSNSEFSGIEPSKIAGFFQKDSGEFKLITIPVNYANQMGYHQRIFAFFKFAILASYKIIQEPQAEFVFATSTPLTIVIPALLRKWLRGTPYIFEVRDLWPELPIAIGALRSPLSIFIARKLELLAYHNASHIIALSPGMKEGIIKRGIPSEKVEVISNACDNKLFRVPNSVGKAFLEKHPELSGGPLIVYIGTLGHINGVEYLAYLASHLIQIIPNAKFLVVGQGVREKEVRAVSQKLGIFEKNFWMWRNIPKEKVPDILSACTVATSLFLPIPEMENNSANKFFDALAAGCPVIINYGGWQKEVLETSGAGFSIPYDDPKVGALELANFLNDFERLKTACSAAEKLADTEFDRDLLYGKLLKVFQRYTNKNSHEQDLP